MPKDQTRVLLLHERPGHQTGYVLMVEVGTQTITEQLTQAEGEEVLGAVTEKLRSMKNRRRGLRP